MRILKIVPVLIVLGMVISPVTVHADPCDDVFAQGTAVFNRAIAAGEAKDFKGAITFYQEAEEYFRRVAATQGCANPKIRITAGRNVGLCRSNAGKIGMALKKLEEDNKTNMETEVFNQATDEYNHGAEAFNNKDWDTASDALESAAALWETIATDKTENGRKARQYAAKARQMADLARQYKWQ